jgi:hypothetical protein
MFFLIEVVFEYDSVVINLLHCGLVQKMMYKNSEAQELFQKALDKLNEIDDSQKSKEKLYATSWIEHIKAYSDSGNEIPALGGKGFEPAIKLSEEILKNGLDGITIDWARAEHFSYDSL